MLYRSLLMVLWLGQFVHAANQAPLADAAEQGNQALVRTLIQQKANVNAAQGDGVTALHWAAMRDDAAIAQMLIDAKPHLNPTTRLGSLTPLHLAAKNATGSVAEAF